MAHERRDIGEQEWERQKEGEQGTLATIVHYIFDEYLLKPFMTPV